MQRYKTIIDIEASIRKKRLVRIQETGDKLFNLFNFGLLIICFSLFSILLISSIYEDFYSEPLGSIIGIAVPVGFLAFLILGAIETSKLYRIIGTTQEENKQQLQLASDKFGWQVLDSSDKHFVMSTPDYRSHVTVIFDQTDLLVNIVTYDRGEMISPLHRFRNRTILNQIKAEFS